MNKTTKNQSLYKVVISMVIMLAVFTNTIAVSAADKTEETTSSSVQSFIGSLFSSLTEANNQNSFPIAGERQPKRTMRVRLSFYSSDPYQTDATPCIPADGSDLCLSAELGNTDAIAANFLSLGTIVRFKEANIDGVTFPEKLFTVRDRMNVRYNGTNYVDVYVAVLGSDGKIDRVASKARAKQLGVKFVEMEIF